MHLIKSKFDKVMCILKKALGENSAVFKTYIKPGPKTKFTDLEVIALSITAECMGYSSENHFFNIIERNQFPNLLSRRQFNDRRKALLEEFEPIRRIVLSKIRSSDNSVVIVDSMPLKLCRYARRFRNKIGKDGGSFIPNDGFCAAQDEKYYGYKLHATCSPDGVFLTFDFTQASVHDVKYLQDIGYNFKNCTVIGDKGYISQPLKEMLKEKSNIRVITEYRKNQKVIEMMPREYKGKRKKIETLFSQLTDQFNIQKNYSKTTRGYFTRVMSKITATTILSLINQEANKPLSQLKYAV